MINTKSTALILTISAFAASLAWAQTTRPASKPGPLVIADFEQPEAVALWSGLKCEQTRAHASSGRHGMRFVLPKWQTGANETPAVQLACDGGKGYPTANWSAYGKLTFEAWVDGDKPAPMSIELRDRKGRSGATTQFTIEPRKMNSGELPLADASIGIDIRNVEEIVFFASRPAQDYAITLDRIRLVPGEKPPIAEFDLIYPNYRGMIFPNAGDPEVEVVTHTDAYGLALSDLVVRLFFRIGKAGPQTVAEYPLKEKRESFAISMVDQPDGPGTLSVGVFRKADKVHVAGREWIIEKLSTYQVSRLKVYVARDNTTIVDGKPFFPLGWYATPDESQLAEIADSPFNCILAYGTNLQPKNQMLRHLNLLQEKGLKLIYALNDVYPTATYLDGKNWEGVTGNSEIADAVVRTYHDHPAILAWYLNDELPRSLAPQLKVFYDRVRANDPSHPCYSVLCNMTELKYFLDTTDVLGVDPYPIPFSPVTVVSQWMDATMLAVNGHKPVWLVPQAFAWYQYKPEGSDRARKPTEADLKSGRAPTYEESRCMTYLALAHGAKGLIYYSYHDMRVLPQYAEMWAGMKKIAAEVRALSPVLLAPDDVEPTSFSPADAPIHTRLKRSDGNLYLIAVNSGDAPAEVTFALTHPLPAQVDAMFEDRKAATDGARLKATFKPLEAHVYNLGPAPN